MVRIGITCDLQAYTDSRSMPAQRYEIGRRYIDAVQHSGGIPIVLPAHSSANHREYLDVVDGLIFSGGDFDIPPSYYNHPPKPGLGNLQEERTEFEYDLMKAALADNVPILGICAGMQLLNVVAGGTLFQDLSERPKTNEHVQPHPKHLPHHAVALSSGSQLHSVFGQDELLVNSTHHQVVDKLGTGINAVAIAPDGVVEAIELPSKPFAVGVQWHPEEMPEPHQFQLYQALVKSAAR